MLIADEDQELVVTPKMARTLCDRGGRFGGDGVLVLSKPKVRESERGIDLVMGYLNADGSGAEMCGNGIRVLVQYARSLGWANGKHWLVATPAGDIEVSLTEDDRYEVKMGQVLIGEPVMVEALGEKFAATKAIAPNPHAVALVEDVDRFCDITNAPDLSPAKSFPHGANVEFVEVTGPRQARMVIYERGSGLTQSCGTGACAVAAVLANEASGNAEGSNPQRYRISVPGGELEVIVGPDNEVTLIGPAVLTDQGEFDESWWQQNS